MIFYGAVDLGFRLAISSFSRNYYLAGISDGCDCNYRTSQIVWPRFFLSVLVCQKGETDRSSRFYAIHFPASKVLSVIFRLRMRLSISIHSF